MLDDVLIMKNGFYFHDSLPLYVYLVEVRSFSFYLHLITLITLIITSQSYQHSAIVCLSFFFFSLTRINNRHISEKRYINKFFPIFVIVDRSIVKCTKRNMHKLSSGIIDHLFHTILNTIETIVVETKKHFLLLLKQIPLRIYLTYNTLQRDICIKICSFIFFFFFIKDIDLKILIACLTISQLCLFSHMNMKRNYIACRKILFARLYAINRDGR